SQGSYRGSLLKVMSLKELKADDSVSFSPLIETPNALNNKAKSKFASTRLSSLHEELKETGASFIDNEFPHDILSLNGDLDDEKMGELRDLTWIKATDLLSSHGQIRVFGD